MSGVVQTEPSSRTPTSTTSKRVGYLVAAVVNAVLLVVVNNLLAWGFPPFLTQDFEEVLPLISLSLGVALVSNVLFLVYDAGWFKSICQITQSAVSFAATLQLYRVFPFDFSPYEFDWALVVQVLLILGLVGIAISVVVELVKLVGAAARQSTAG